MEIKMVEVIAMFYINEYIYSKILQDKEEKFLHSHKKFVDDFLKFRAKFAHKLAQIFYDYIIFAAMEEMQNAYEECEFTPYKLLGTRCYTLNYSSIIERIQKLDLKSFFKMCENIYGNCYWNMSFGGMAWYDIIQICQQFGKIDDVLFCDKVIDMQHNTGSVLSKSNPYFQLRGNLRKLLDLKAYQTKEALLFRYLIDMISKTHNREVFNIYWRFGTLYLKNELKEEFLQCLKIQWHTNKRYYISEEYFPKFIGYKPITYTGYYNSYEIVPSIDVLYEAYPNYYKNLEE